MGDLKIEDIMKTSKPEASQLVESLCDGGHSVAGKLE